MEVILQTWRQVLNIRAKAIADNNNKMIQVSIKLKKCVLEYTIKDIKLIKTLTDSNLEGSVMSNSSNERNQKK